MVTRGLIGKSCTNKGFHANISTIVAVYERNNDSSCTDLLFVNALLVYIGIENEVAKNMGASIKDYGDICFEKWRFLGSIEEENRKLVQYILPTLITSSLFISVSVMKQKN